MYTCYLFADKFDDENCLCIRLDDAGYISDPLAVRSLDEFRLLQQNSKTVIVLSAQLAGIHAVEVPLLSDSKAKPVIAYALEENLAESVAHLHFAFDKYHYFAGKYLVVVIEKQIMSDLQNRLDKLQIGYNYITCDWFALSVGETCVIANRYMVNDVNFRGALDLDLFEVYLNSQTDFSHIIIFNDSPALPHSENFTKFDLDAYAWVAKKLHSQKAINLCQGEFAHNTSCEVSQKYLKLASVLAGVLLISLLASNIISLVLLNKQLALYDKKIAVVYREFFPDARQVISPRFRISQILQKNHAGYNATFWQLLAKFSLVVNETNNPEDLIIDRISMQNNKLEISISCRDFDVLEKIENLLKSKMVNVHKSGVITQGDKVLATLELAL